MTRHGGFLKRVCAAGLFIAAAAVFCFAQGNERFIPRTKIIAASGYSKAGMTIVTGGARTTMGIVEPDSDEPSRSKFYPQASAAALSADTNDLVLAEVENGIVVYKTESGRKSHTINSLSSGVTALRLSPMDRVLASGDLTGAVKFWRFVDGKLLTEAVRFDRPVMDIVFSPYGRFAAMLSESGELALFDFQKKELVWKKAIPFPAFCMMFSPLEDRIYIGSKGWLAFITTDGNKTEPKFRQLPSDVLITSLGYDPTERILAAGLEKGGVLAAMYMKPDLGEFKQIYYDTEQKAEFIAQTKFSPDGAFLYACTDMGFVHKFELNRSAQQPQALSDLQALAVVKFSTERIMSAPEKMLSAVSPVMFIIVVLIIAGLWLVFVFVMDLRKKTLLARIEKAHRTEEARQRLAALDNTPLPEITLLGKSGRLTPSPAAAKPPQAKPQIPKLPPQKSPFRSGEEEVAQQTAAAQNTAAMPVQHTESEVPPMPEIRQQPDIAERTFTPPAQEAPQQKPEPVVNKPEAVKPEEKPIPKETPKPKPLVPDIWPPEFFSKKDTPKPQKPKEAPVLNPYQQPGQKPETRTETHLHKKKHELPSGLIAGKYKVMSELGRGGMSIVYEAEDVVLGKRFALKKLRDEIASDKHDRERFMTEARITAQLKHPNVVDIYTILEEKDDIYLVFELVEGKTLEALLYKYKRLPLRESAGIAMHILSALGYAHSKNVLHRDLKPSNVMVSKDGFVRVMDFGIAKVVQGKDSKAKAELSGTMAYMAPEQHVGAHDHRADVFAFGATLYEMLSGKLPFLGPDVLAQKKGRIYRPLPDIVTGLPTQIVQIVDKCMSPDMHDRYNSAVEIYKAIKKCPLDSSKPLPRDAHH